MIYSVKITKQADEDLRAIYEYIAIQLKSFENANAQLERLEKNILKLREMPLRFKAYEKELWRSRGLRIMPVDNYIVFYIADDFTGIVTITRVMYGGREIDKQL